MSNEPERCFHASGFHFFLPEDGRRSENDDGAQGRAQNLANRVGLSILKNWQTIQSTKLPGQRMISSITFETYYPLGTIQVNGKSERLPVTGLVLNIKHKVNWTMCCRNLTNNQGD